ncbi:MAG TPA: hypothetical protein VGO17_07540 [Aurantimonas sp.]|nr:hypothetical protein [Aurantimonas sp.]
MSRMLDSLDPVVQTYGGLDLYLIIEMLSEELDLSRKTLEAAIRDEANKREIPLLPVHRHTTH